MSKKPMGCFKQILIILGATSLLVALFGYFAYESMQDQAAKLDAMTPAERLEYENSIRRSECKTQRLYEIRSTIKSNLKDPDSFKELNLQTYTNAIEITYSATNSFGGRIGSTYRYVYEPDICGKNIKVEEIK
ncbi:hypothetical protein N9Q82_04270 [Gammaproteobacteria bacterium]|nr:hypothetical protein [Gammaproteobacteria bacterium]